MSARQTLFPPITVAALNQARVAQSSAALPPAAEAVLVAGSSLMVYSGLRFCRAARGQGKPIVAVNDGRTRADELLALKVQGDCGVALAALVDVVRFGLGVGIVGNLNFLLVWLALHQCGFASRDGSLTTPVAVGLLGVGAVGLVLAVTRGPYPVSMVGLPGDEGSNMAPPTAALPAQGLALIGIAALLRGPMGRVLARPRVWRWVVLAGAFAMTAFLWHLTALLLVLLSARALRLGLPEVGTSLWWWTRPVWFAVLTVPTAALVAVFARFDRGPKSVETSAGRGGPVSYTHLTPPARELGGVSGGAVVFKKKNKRQPRGDEYKYSKTK